MKRIYLLTGLVSAFWLCYFLYQNIIVFNIGWKALPTTLFDHRFLGQAAPSYSPAIDASRHALKKIHSTSMAPAVSIAVRIRQETVWSEAVGLQNIENEVPADTLSRFRIGSTSKALTSLALGTLLDERKIHLDSSIQYYTGRFENTERISIRQLASHQSGIRNYSTCLCTPIWEYYRKEDFQSVAESLEDFENDKLLFSPGEQFSYSSYNFTALSHALETATGTDFLKLMESHVFEPLKMSNTVANLKKESSISQSEFYEVQHKEYKIAPEVNLSNKWAGGGFLSTPSDLVKAGNALLQNKLLTPQTIETLIEPQQLNSDSINPQNYALGWRHGITKRFFEGQREIEIIHHGGMAVGSQSLLIVFPECEMVVSLLMSKSGKQGQFLLFDYLTPIIESFIIQLDSENQLATNFAK